LLDRGIIGGYDLSQDYPKLKNRMLVCVTETNSKEEIDALVEALGEVKTL
jgi:glycine dehydrogenase subunit 1